MDDLYEGMEIEDDSEFRAAIDAQVLEFTAGFGGGFDLNDFLGAGNLRRNNTAESSSSGQGGAGVNLNLALGDAPSSSSAGAVPEREIPDHDSHNKRPKVHSFSL